MTQNEEILDKACMVCGRANRFHRIFWSPYVGCYVRQGIEDMWLDEPLVPSSDHYSIIDNLYYLEWKDLEKSHE